MTKSMDLVSTLGQQSMACVVVQGLAEDVTV